MKIKKIRVDLVVLIKEVNYLNLKNKIIYNL